MARILFYIDNMQRGGAQRVMANLVDHFSAQGHDVILCNDYMLAPERPRYAVAEGVRRRWLEKEWSGNVAVQNIRRITRLRKLIRAEKPEVCVSFLAGPNIRLLIGSLGIKTCKIVSVRNDPNREYSANPIVKGIIRGLFSLSDGFVFQTEDAKTYFNAKVQAKSCVIMNPVDPQFFDIKRSSETRHIVTLGRLMNQKNHKMLIDAFVGIAGEYPQEQLILYGIGNLKAELIAYAAAFGLRERVLFPGNTAEVARVLSTAKVFVLSSDYEGMPNALMEAMAAGVPCISTDCPCGGPRMLAGGTDAVTLVPVGNSEALADRLRALLSSEARMEALGKAARKRAQQFRPALILAQWDAFIMSRLTKAERS